MSVVGEQIKLARLRRNLSVAQVVERDLAKVEVASSSLVARSKQRNGPEKPFLLYGDIAKW